MMSVSDVFKKSFLDGFSTYDIGTSAAIAVMLTAGLLSLYLFVVYRVVTRKTFYSKTFNISLAGITLITAALILTIQSSIVVSLGMVGALSIVRFRTAIKDPMDLMFLFWSITVGIICGVGLAKIAVILSVALTLAVLVLDRLPVAKAPQILVVNASDLSAEDTVMEIVKKHARSSSVKSRNMTASSLDLVVELRTDAGSELLRELMAAGPVVSASLLRHDGEVTF
jgi:uncharacterized membrane protein YhiD involved in acid resistance